MFRTLLLNIRKLGAQLNDKQKLAITFLVIVLWGIGITMDILLPYNLFINSIRAGICLISGVLTFALLYLLAIWLGERNQTKNPEYLTIRQRFTYRARINMAIVFWTALVISLLMSSHPSTLYTFLNSWIIVAAFSILTFTRASRDEFLRMKYGAADERDVDMDERVSEVIQKRREKAEQKRAKKQRKKEERWIPQRKLDEKHENENSDEKEE